MDIRHYGFSDREVGSLDKERDKGREMDRKTDIWGQAFW